ncbi:MAG TPA: hypothetical protein VGW58_08020 [Pyrinomonadaceae bacterium]|nr:hypothetical protein [Pyrinomonadaceae bacterium]
MNPHKHTFRLFLASIAVFLSAEILLAKGPTGGRLAIVVDERLAALRRTPQLNGPLVRRLGRGRKVAIRASKTNSDGTVFLLVNVTTRTHGWIQREALAAPSRSGDDQHVVDLINASMGFDQIARARIFLDNFTRSPLRPQVLLLMGNAAEQQAAKLSGDATKRLSGTTTQAPEFTYFMNFSGLDRYNRLRVGFVFHPPTRRFYYDGAVWRELVRRYPKSPESAEARKHLAELAAISQ